MTNEEKAEITKEYLNNTFKQTEANQLAIMIGQKCFYEGLEKGLAEGRKEKWHDLREDPNDLPKIDGDYLCRIYLYKADTTFPNVLYFDPSCKGFVLEEGGEPFEVKAWCELPKFEE